MIHLDNPDDLALNVNLEGPTYTEAIESTVIHNPFIDHQLRPSVSRSNFSSLSIPIDPFRDMQMSMT